MPGSYLIYGLIDPRTDEIRYVGQSSQGIVRATHHRMECFLKQSEHTYKSKWIRKLQRLGLDYGIKVLEEVERVEDLDWVETFWILQMRSLLGKRLTNATDGGGGCKGLPRTAEWKRKISEAQKGEKGFWYGKKRSAGSRLKQSRSHGGRPVWCSNGTIYPTVAEAARQLGLDEDNLRRAAKNERHSLGGGKGPGSRGRGLKFKYLEVTQPTETPAAIAATTQEAPN